jgi:hypothetical protein
VKKLGAGLCLAIFITLVACGGNVNVGGSGGSGGTGSNAIACPGPGSADQDVTELENKPCATDAEVCSSNNGCGGCSVTCKNGKWTSTDSTLCYSIGGTC